MLRLVLRPSMTPRQRLQVLLSRWALRRKFRTAWFWHDWLETSLNLLRIGTLIRLLSSRQRSTTPVFLPSVSHCRSTIELSLTTLAGYTQALRPGVKASFGLALDTQRLNEINPTGPTHKVRPSLYSLFSVLIVTVPLGWSQHCVRVVELWQFYS
jgi:hypothetical protein